MPKIKTKYAGNRVPESWRLTDQENVEVYKQLHLPKIPVVHPYHPEGGSVADQRLNHGVPIFSVAQSLPNRGAKQWPAGVSEQLKRVNVSPENVEVFFCVQDRPWQNTPLLLRPHPWLHPHAPFQQKGYNKVSGAFVGVFDLHSSIDTLPLVRGISSHSGQSDMVVYSATQMPVEGVEDFTQTHAFYSLCIEPETRKAALTLHWLLNDADQIRVQAVLEQTNTLAEFIKGTSSLDKSVLNGTLQDVPWTPLLALDALLQDNQPDPVDTDQYRLKEQSKRIVSDKTPSIPPVFQPTPSTSSTAVDSVIAAQQRPLSRQADVVPEPQAPQTVATVDVSAERIAQARAIAAQQSSNTGMPTLSRQADPEPSVVPVPQAPRTVAVEVKSASRYV